MSLERADFGALIDVRPLGAELARSRTTALAKTEQLEIIRLVVPRGKEIPTHATQGEITVQCLEGRVAFTVGDVVRDLKAGRLLHLKAGQPHSVVGVEDASLLVTITFAKTS